MRGDVVEICTKNPPPTKNKTIYNYNALIFVQYVYIYSKNSSPEPAYPNSVEYLFHRREDQISSLIVFMISPFIVCLPLPQILIVGLWILDGSRVFDKFVNSLDV